MKELKRAEYKKFVEQHILRPYQDMIFDSEKALNFTKKFYDSIPALVDENEEWADCVFNRISDIYSSIDGDYFPQGKAQMVIVVWMGRKGVKVNW